MAILKDYYNTGEDATYADYGVIWLAQTFTTSSTYYVDSIKVKIYRVGSPGTCTISLRATAAGDPTGSDITGSTQTFDGDAITTSTDGEWKEISLASGNVQLSTTTTYAIILRATSGNASNKLLWMDDSGSAYAGQAYQSVNSGVAWSSLGAGKDFMFEVYGATAPVDKTYSKQLVAIGNSEVWYESTAGTMTELTAANGDINTLNALNAATAFQKLFIANKANKKVFDFVNVKLTSSTLSATNPPDFGTVLTGSGSGATMIVDYCSTLTGTASVYGKQTSTASFVSTDTVTGTDDDGNAISFTLTAPQDDGPHWYTWTPFGNSSTFGTMPTSAYLICRYRGRLVLAGNPNYPHQWYMSRVANPWNWLYGTLDPLTAVAGNNTDAGEVGDIIKALIPYGDDYLVFGCSSSIWLLDGDPAAGGSLDEITKETGIYGPQSWCKDNNGNLYFWGSSGLYRMVGGRGKPENLSIVLYPKWTVDWAVEPATHRITLSFDPQYNSIVISKTNLDDGTNANFVYDLKTEGLYPESYPDECGIYSSMYYEADDSDYRALLLGCNDGYIRYFDESTKYDDGTAATAITSYFNVAPFAMGDGIDYEGKIRQIILESSGGASGGTFADSSGFTYAVYIADDAETCIENAKDWATPSLLGTISGTGRKSRIRQNIRGQYATITILNNTISTAFAINRIMVDKDLVGRLKDV